jgi:hypothetical protein
MSVSGFNESLANLNNNVQIFASEAVVALSDERLAALSGQYQRAGELAMELSGVMEAIAAGIEECAPLVKPISWWGAKKRAPLLRQAEQVTSQESSTLNLSESERVVELIQVMGISGLADLDRIFSRDAEELPEQITVFKKTGENALKRAAAIPKHITTAVEELHRNQAEVDRIITSKLVE